MDFFSDADTVSIEVDNNKLLFFPINSAKDKAEVKKSVKKSTKTTASSNKKNPSGKRKVQKT